MIKQTVIMQRETESEARNRDELSPFIREFFMVQAFGFRGMAYRDEQGLWRTAFNHIALAGDVCILE